MRVLLSALVALSLSACSTTNFAVAKWKDWNTDTNTQTASSGNFKVGKPYYVDGRRYTPQESYSLDETGIASWYGPGFHGARTANGEKYDQYELTAAHRTLQLPALVRVTNLQNGKSVVVRVNDRGPFSKGRIIDVSKRAADLLGFIGQGTARVRVQVLAEESRQLAEMARRGMNTRGTELALNGLSGGHPLVPLAGPTQVQQVAYVPPQPAAPVSPKEFWEPTSQPTAHQAATTYTPSGVKGHTSQDGRFYPDPVVKQFPVVPTSIYVQAGAYTDPVNARKASQALSHVGIVKVAQVDVRGTVYYRVQVGPLPTVDDADKMLSQVINSGYPEARIIVNNSS